MSRRNEEAEVLFSCDMICDTQWHVEGRFNAEGKFELIDDDNQGCPVCGEPGAPLDMDIELA